MRVEEKNSSGARVQGCRGDQFSPPLLRSSAPLLAACCLLLLGCHQPPHRPHQPNPEAIREHRLGQVLAKEGKILEAFDQYTRATSIDSMFVEAWLDLAEVSLRLLDLKKAEEACHRALSADSAHRSAHYTLGTVLLKEGRFAEAMTLFREIVRRDPQFVPARLSLGWSLLALGLFDEAEAEFRQVITIDPNRAEGYVGSGDIAIKRGDIEEALTAYKQAISLNPELVSAYYALGIVYQRRGLIPEAVEAFQRGAEVDSTESAIHYRLGVIYTGERRQREGDNEMKRYRRLREQHETIRRSEEAVIRSPDDVGARRALGKTYLRFGRTADGEREYRLSLRLGPDDPETHLVLGCLLFRRRRFTEAASEFQEVLRIAPDSTAVGHINPIGHFNLGITMMTQGRTDEALPEFNATATFASEWPPLSFAFGVLYEQAGRLPESRKAFDRFLQLSNRTPADSAAVVDPEHHLQVYEEM